MLSEEGYDVVGQAGDGATAIELAEELRPDLVILDVKMPVLDGIAAAERIAGAADRAGGHPDRLLPARPGRARPRRRRDGLPGQAVQQDRPGAGHRDGGEPVRRARRCSRPRSPTSPSGSRPARPSTGPRACCRSSSSSPSRRRSAGSRRPRWTCGCRCGRSPTASSPTAPASPADGTLRDVTVTSRFGKACAASRAARASYWRFTHRSTPRLPSEPGRVLEWEDRVEVSTRRPRAGGAQGGSGTHPRAAARARSSR